MANIKFFVPLLLIWTGSLSAFGEQPRTFVVTGDPGSGKSSVLRQLAQSGACTVTPEAATEIFLLWGAKGRSPFETPNLEVQIFNLQMRQERAAVFAAIGQSHRNVMVDRGIGDVIAYGLLYNERDDLGIIRAALAKSPVTYQKSAFFVLPHGAGYERGANRPESEARSELHGRNSRLVHEALGFDLILVESGTVEDRAQFLLNKVESDSANTITMTAELLDRMQADYDRIRQMLHAEGLSLETFGQ